MYCLKVWNRTNCQTFKDYMEIYLRIDCGLFVRRIHWMEREFVCRIWFRHVSLFDSILFWIWRLFKTHVYVYWFDIWSWIDQFNWKNVRRGFTSVVRRYARANNKHVNPNFNPLTDISKYSLHLDFNSLYATTLMSLNYNNVKWNYSYLKCPWQNEALTAMWVTCVVTL